MRTDNDIKDDVYLMLEESQLKTSVSGQILKIARNPSSRKEDVIISVLANDNPRQVQEAFVSVNIYVADKDITVNGETYKVEDTIRTKELARIIADMFENAYIGDKYRLTLSSQRVIAVDATHEHCINNRLLYQCVNES